MVSNPESLLKYFFEVTHKEIKVRLLQLLKEVFLSVFDNLFYFLSIFIPKKNSLWLFGSMFGDKYADNSKYLFEYVNSHHPEIRAVWFSANSETVSSIRNKGFEAYRFYDPRGILLALRAKVGFISHSVIRDIRPFVFTSNTLLVNLWHGIPLKRIALDDNVSELRNKTSFLPFQRISQLLCPAFRRQSDLLIAASIEDQKNFSTAFNYPLEQIKITGYPRNDVIFSNRSKPTKKSSVKKGIYVPTFRGKEGSNYDFFDQFGFDVEVIDQSLSELNTQLYLKLHHFNLPTKEMQNLIHSAENIFFYNEVDIYGDFSSFDFLITDFSSIYFDFLLLERPIIFAPFDMAGFEGAVRQLYYEYNDVTPGPKAQDWLEVMQCIEKVLNCPEEYSAGLESTKERFHHYADGGSSKRVYEEVMLLLERDGI